MAGSQEVLPGENASTAWVLVAYGEVPACAAIDCLPFALQTLTRKFGMIDRFSPNSSHGVRHASLLPTS